MTDPQRQFFDQHAPGWEARCYPAETRDRLAALCDQLALKGAKVALDLGSGTGVLYPYLRRALGTDARILALDISFAMLHEGADKAWQPDDLRIQGNALALPLADDSVDLVLCFAAFPHFADPALAFAEMARVTRADQDVIIAHLMSRDELRRHHGGHRQVAQDLLPAEPQMRRLFDQAGLSAVRIHDRPGLYLARAKVRPRATPQDRRAHA